MLVAIAKEDTLFRSKLELVIIEGAQVGPTCITKDSKILVIMFDMEQSFNQCFNLDNLARCMIYKIHNNTKGFIPEFEGHGVTS
jgi:hypothetical protein